MHASHVGVADHFTLFPRTRAFKNQMISMFFKFSKTLTLGLLLMGLVKPLATAADTGATASPDVLQIRGNNDFAPYEYLDEKGVPAGYNIDMIKAIGRVMGLTYHIQLEPWALARENLEKGSIDALTGVIYSEERDKLFDFSIPHISISYAIFVRKNSDIKTPEDLKGKEVIVVESVYAHDWLKRHRFTPRGIAVEKPEKALRILSAGQHDATVLIRLHGLELMRELEITNLQTVGPPVLTRKMGFAVRAGESDLLSKLNEGLYILQTSGEYDQIYLKWFSTKEQIKNLIWIIRIGKIVVIPLIVFLAVAALLIRYLNKTVERKTRALRSREWLLDRIIQGTPVPTLVSDPDGKITYWNRACEKLSGIRAADLVGTTGRKNPELLHKSIFLSILAEATTHKEQLKLFRRRIKQSDVLQGALGTEVFVPWVGKNGRWLYGTIAPFEDEHGNRLGVIETWQDLTDRKELETQLLQAQKMEAMGSLARGVAHDFNNYLQTILSLAESAGRETPKDSPIREYMHQIDAAIRRARALIQQILTFGRENLDEPKPVIVAPIVEKTLKLIAPAAPGTIEFRPEIASNAMIMADDTKVGQVVMNLCTNAVQAMDGLNGILGVQLQEVELTDEHGFIGQQAVSGSFLKLTVSDTGNGIDKNYLDRIFEPFFTTRKHNGGTGMGLAIVHGIVRGYGGKISVKSRPGEGCTFEVLWPIIEPGY